MREAQIRKLIALLREHDDIGEIEAFSGPFGLSRIRVSKQSSAVVAAPAAAPAAPQSAASPAPAAENVEGLYEVTAPMVGTYYSSPNPGSDPFIQDGSKVQSGTVLCIIEAMKLMNEIECGVSGTIKEILVENGAPVEFGQVLLRIQED
jgi:acetyl-CoA carboxylase biotin carboxyl carrier protein